MFSFQNYTNSENILVAPCGETYAASHDPNQAVNIKAEEVSVAQEEGDPVGITNQEIKVELEVSCVFLYVHC
jgi:argininosuccinate synthase